MCDKLRRELLKIMKFTGSEEIRVVVDVNFKYIRPDSTQPIKNIQLLFRKLHDLTVARLTVFTGMDGFGADLDSLHVDKSSIRRFDQQTAPMNDPPSLVNVNVSLAFRQFAIVPQGRPEEAHLLAV